MKDDLESMTVASLKKICKSENIKCGRRKKKELIAYIRLCRVDVAIRNGINQLIALCD